MPRNGFCLFPPFLFYLIRLSKKPSEHKHLESLKLLCYTASKGVTVSIKNTHDAIKTILKSRSTLGVIPPDFDMNAWDEGVVKSTGHCHFLQSGEWAKVKSQTAWQARALIIEDDKKTYPMLVYSRSTPVFGRLHYIPKLSSLSSIDVAPLTLKLKNSIQRGVAICIEIDSIFSQELHQELAKNDWRSASSVQYDHTVLVDLSQPDEALRSSFKKRARWEISASQRRGVVVERIECNRENLELMYGMLKLTAERGHFRTRGKVFSNSYWHLFSREGKGFLYQARHEHDILSMAYVILIGPRAYYKDGASTREKANLFASRYLQWGIMRDLRSLGCCVYDLGGVISPEKTDNKNKGIFTFKTGFGEPVRLQGAYDLPLTGRRYGVWKKFEPKLLKLYLAARDDLWY